MKTEQGASTARVEHLDNGKLTIPADFQEAIGARSDDLVEMKVIDQEIHLKRLEYEDMAVSNEWVRKLYEYFAPVRAEAEAAGLTEGEINDAIDEALREVRAEQR